MFDQESTRSGGILIVEDDAIVAVNLQKILNRQGYQVLKRVPSGEEALETLGIGPALPEPPVEVSEEKQLPDLVLMDIHLAGQLSGIQTAAQIRAHLDIPLIYLTAHAEDELLQKAKLTEPHGYLVKPVQHQELCATIEMAVYKHKMEKALRESQERLKAYAEHLEDMVEERTQKLREAWDRMLRQERLAMLGQLVGGMAHELLNPLAAIKAALYVLEVCDLEFQPDEKYALEILDKEVNVSEQIIANLLAFAQPKPPALSKVKVNDIIQTALSRTVITKNVEVVKHLDETLPTIMADPAQLTMVLGNIIGNAGQSMPKGGRLAITSTLAMRNDTPHCGSYVAISIADTGAGIPRENLEKIFEPLFTTKPKGIGLGLALCKTLIEKMRGSIEVTSEFGEGSTFIIWLPVTSG
jgi:signal transduction histidine kinase